MRFCNKNNVIDKEMWLLLWHEKQNDKAIPRHILDNMSKKTDARFQRRQKTSDL